MEKPFLSVLISIHNGELFIRDSVEAVLNQPCKDLELWLMDNGSTDRTFAIAQEYASKDPRVKVTTHEDWGIGRNRNDGLERAAGQWVIFCDVDDMVRPGFYTESLKGLLMKCDEAGIETIVGARVLAEDRLERASFNPVANEGVYEGVDACLDLPYEYATILYSRNLFDRDSLRFATTVPEMESIFRHQAVYLSRKSLRTNELWFMIRRDNLHQITANWNYSKVVPVRAQAYENLLIWHKERGSREDVIAWAEQKAHEAASELSITAAKKGFFERRREKKAYLRTRDELIAGFTPLEDFYPSEDDFENSIVRMKEQIAKVTV